MGSHRCPPPATGFIHGLPDPFCRTSSSRHSYADFSSGIGYCFPDALAYYVLDCGYQPPEEFIRDVMAHTPSVEHVQTLTTRTLQSKSIGYDKETTNIGHYCLSGEIPVGFCSETEVNAHVAQPWNSAHATCAAFARKLFETFPHLKEHLVNPATLDDAITRTAARKQPSPAAKPENRGPAP